MSDETVTIPLETAQRLFDALATSMDFGSGFLETDDVKALRELAVLIGVDPLLGTPDTFVKDYPHPFKPMTDPLMIARVFDMTRSEWNGTQWVSVPGPGQPPFVPCQRGAYPYCQKDENHPLHAAA